MWLALAMAWAQEEVPRPAEPPAEEVTPEQAPAPPASPNQVDVNIGNDLLLRQTHTRFAFLEPYLQWKRNVRDKIGLGWSIDYSSGVMASAQSAAQPAAASGMVRFYGSWNLVDRDGGFQGGLVFKLEHRHRYTDLAIKEWSFQSGGVYLQLPPFSNQGFRFTNLYWKQSFVDRRIVLLAGFLDPTDYLDVYALASPWLHYLNFAFSTGSSSIGLPNEGMGVALGAWITPQLYAIASINDTNSDPHRPFDTFASFFRYGQLFKSFELGFSPSREQAYTHNVHVAAWHTDTNQAGADSGWGINASVSWTFLDSIMPFIRGGYAKGGGSLFEGSVSTGIAYQWIPGQDVLGFGFNWGRPNQQTYGERLRDQYTFEWFYRLQLADQLAITPDIQLIIHPALDQTVPVQGLFGLRARIVL